MPAELFSWGVPIPAIWAEHLTSQSHALMVETAEEHHSLKSTSLLYTRFGRSHDYYRFGGLTSCIVWAEMPLRKTAKREEECPWCQCAYNLMNGDSPYTYWSLAAQWPLEWMCEPGSFTQASYNRFLTNKARWELIRKEMLGFSWDKVDGVTYSIMCYSAAALKQLQKLPEGGKALPDKLFA